MTVDRGEMKIRVTLKQGKEDALSGETVHIFPVSRWKIYIILAPAFIALAFLSAFFFLYFSLCFYLEGLSLASGFCGCDGHGIDPCV